MTDKKTVAEIVEEHQKRQEKPEFSTLVFENGRTYHNITNFKEIGDRFPEYEFDSEWNGKITHINISTSPLIKEKFVEEVSGWSDIIAKNCVLVHVYTNSGKTEEFSDVQNLKENKKNVEVEFDFIEDGKKCHMKMSGRITKYAAALDEEDEK